MAWRERKKVCAYIFRFFFQLEGATEKDLSLSLDLSLSNVKISHLWRYSSNDPRSSAGVSILDLAGRSGSKSGQLSICPPRMARISVVDKLCFSKETCQSEI